MDLSPKTRSSVLRFVSFASFVVPGASQLLLVHVLLIIYALHGTDFTMAGETNEVIYLPIPGAIKFELIISIAGMVLAGFVVVTRLVVRFNGAGFGWDDGLVVAAYVSLRYRRPSFIRGRILDFVR